MDRGIGRVGGMETRKLKACPFCGSMKTGVFDYPYKKPGLRGCYVFCERCGASGGKHDTIEKAVNAWNSRKGADNG